MLDILQQIFNVCIFPLLTVLTAFIVAFIKKKTEEISEKATNEKEQKYIQLLSKIITEAVTSTNQVYVESLKKQNKFDAEAQTEAFNQTYQKVITVLSDNAKEILSEACGDLEQLITIGIEAEVNNNKIDKVAQDTTAVVASATAAAVTAVAQTDK